MQQSDGAGACAAAASLVVRTEVDSSVAWETFSRGGRWGYECGGGREGEGRGGENAGSCCEGRKEGRKGIGKVL